MTEYPPSRAYRTRVSRIEALSPHFTRMTLSAPDLVHFGTGGLDQRIKILVPTPTAGRPDESLFELPMSEWYPAWRMLPPEERNPMRTYTVRAIRPEAAEIDLDFVLHGTEGPASAWATTAAVGDELVVIGPDSRSTVNGGGIEWRPGEARSVLLAGDETAVPAIGAILETLDESFTGSAYLEVPDAADIADIRSRSAVSVNWLVRGEREHGAALDAAVREWGAREIVPQRPAEAVPEGEEMLWEVPDAVGHSFRFAWLAGESGVITGLRRHLVRDLGMDRRAIAFMGYWKRGKAELN